MNSKRVRPSRESATVTLLGTGDAFSSGGRSFSGYLIDLAGTRILMEAGPDILGSLKRNSIDPATIDSILISHLHGDHFGGIPFLMLEYMWESPLDHPLTIAGPRNLEERCWRLLATMYPHFEVERVRAKLRFVVVEPQRTSRVGAAKIRAIRSPHTRPDISLSLKIELGGKSIVFSGDTGWNDKLPPFAAGANLFLCECTYYESKHLVFHMNYPELAANRDLFKVDRMVLTHVGREVLNHKRDVRIEMGADGMQIRI